MVRVTPVIPMLDPIIHIEARPFCTDKTCLCHAERFIVTQLGSHTAEFDQELRVLHLCWAGDQTFLTREESLRLLTLLLEVFPDYSV